MVSPYSGGEMLPESHVFGDDVPPHLRPASAGLRGRVAGRSLECLRGRQRVKEKRNGDGSEKGARVEAGWCVLLLRGCCRSLFSTHLVKYVVQLVRRVEEHAIRVSCARKIERVCVQVGRIGGGSERG